MKFIFAIHKPTLWCFARILKNTLKLQKISCRKDFWQKSIYLFNRHLVGGDAALVGSCELMRSKTYQTLVDFDNHLDDITLDWLNPHLNKVIELTSTE